MKNVRASFERIVFASVAISMVAFGRLLSWPDTSSDTWVETKEVKAGDIGGVVCRAFALAAGERTIHGAIPRSMYSPVV